MGILRVHAPECGLRLPMFFPPPENEQGLDPCVLMLLMPSQGSKADRRMGNSHRWPRPRRQYAARHSLWSNDDCLKGASKRTSGLMM